MIKNAAVRIDAGCVAELGAAREVAGGPVVDFGDALILPGLVNAHTHLELGYCRGRLAVGGDFAGWLGDLVRLRRGVEDLAAAVRRSVREGAAESVSAGVTTVGDVTSMPDVVRPVLMRGPLRCVSFGEVIAFGVDRDRLPERLEAAGVGSAGSEFLAVGVSPHSPYTVEPEGLRACADLVRAESIRLCVHLAETADEARFTVSGEGRLASFLDSLGLMDDAVRPAGLRPVTLAQACGLLGPESVLAHCNYLNEEDVSLIAASGAHVAYCPRTHAAFGHPRHPFERLAAAGVNVCVGTDSLASNPSLSILDELRFVGRAVGGVGPETLLRMGTINGARALGMADRVGAISVGRCADLTVIPLDPVGSADPLENVLGSTLQPVATFVGGRRVC